MGDGMDVETVIIKRINSLTQNAKKTWLVLLGFLFFLGVTMLGLGHIAFYGVGHSTKLPIIDITVPIRPFFIAAPILTAAIYGYFHLYLVRLWDALGEAKSEYAGKALGDLIEPWLINDAALHIRNSYRKDGSSEWRVLDVIATTLNIIVAWGFGIFMLATIWVVSMAARDFWLTVTSGISFSLALTVGLVSLSMLLLRMKGAVLKAEASLVRNVDYFIFAVFIALSLLVMVISHLRTTGSEKYLFPVTIIGEEIVRKPADWKPLRVIQNEILLDWCNKVDLEDCNNLGIQTEGFRREWSLQLESYVASFRKPQLGSLNSPQLLEQISANLGMKTFELENLSLETEKAEQARQFLRSQAENSINLKGVDFRASFISGVNLNTAQLQRAMLSNSFLNLSKMIGAQLDKANLVDAQMVNSDMRWSMIRRAALDKSDLSGANLAYADLSNSSLNNANLSSANFKGAILSASSLGGANLTAASLESVIMAKASAEFTNFEGADLRMAYMEGASLRNSNLRNATLGGVIADGTSFKWANFEGANLSGAQLADSDLSYSLILGNQESVVKLYNVDIRNAVNKGGALRHVDMSDVRFNQSTDFRDIFLDGTVRVSEKFKKLMGNPCQWTSEALDDEDFFSRWRWWFELNTSKNSLMSWEMVAPEQWKDVEAWENGDDGCYPSDEEIKISRVSRSAPEF